MYVLDWYSLKIVLYVLFVFDESNIKYDIIDFKGVFECRFKRKRGIFDFD